ALMMRLMKWLKRVSCKASISAQPIWSDESKAAQSQNGYTNMPCARCTATMASAHRTTKRMTTATTRTERREPGKIGFTQGLLWEPFFFKTRIGRILCAADQRGRPIHFPLGWIEVRAPLYVFSVAQTSESAVSHVSKPAGGTTEKDAPAAGMPSRLGSRR